jgi:hypothetical protein
VTIIARHDAASLCEGQERSGVDTFDRRGGVDGDRKGQERGEHVRTSEDTTTHLNVLC